MIFQIIIAALYLTAIVFSVLALKEAWRARKHTRRGKQGFGSTGTQ